jgi:acyl-CoA synthetase (AMP-forming)/AMP-acid ligase II
VTYGTVKDAEGIDKLQQATNGSIKGVITTDNNSLLSQISFLQSPLVVASDNDANDTLQQLIEVETKCSSEASKSLDLEHQSVDVNWGYYNSTTGLTHAEVVRLGVASASHLKMTQTDKVCVSITLCHSFGIGSACAAALSSGATVVLPAVGGTRGCGVPSQRAEATLRVLASEQCTLLFADTHTLKALEPLEVEGSSLQALRGGVVKVGSGTDFMSSTSKYQGVPLANISQLVM